MQLSEIEKVVLRSLAEGMQSKEIAAVVRRSKATVDGYIRILYIKLDSRSRAQLVARALALGCLTYEKQNSA